MHSWHVQSAESNAVNCQFVWQCFGQYEGTVLVLGTPAQCESLSMHSSRVLEKNGTGMYLECG